MSEYCVNCEALAKRVEEAERMLQVRVDEFDEERRHHLDIREQRRSEVTRLREALRFYANPDCYEGGSEHDWTGDEPVLKDGGKRARKALRGGVNDE